MVCEYELSHTFPYTFKQIVAAHRKCFPTNKRFIPYMIRSHVVDEVNTEEVWEESRLCVFNQDALSTRIKVFYAPLLQFLNLDEVEMLFVTTVNWKRQLMLIQVHNLSYTKLASFFSITSYQATQPDAVNYHTKIYFHGHPHGNMPFGLERLTQIFFRTLGVDWVTHVGERNCLKLYARELPKTIEAIHHFVKEAQEETEEKVSLNATVERQPGNGGEHTTKYLFNANALHCKTNKSEKNNITCEYNTIVKHFALRGPTMPYKVFTATTCKLKTGRRRLNTTIDGKNGNNLAATSNKFII